MKPYPAGTAGRPQDGAGTAPCPPGDAVEGAAPSAPLPSRRHPAHQPICERADRPVLVYLTVCTQGRKPILARADAAAALRQAWAKARLWQVGRWVLMPDHLHLFCAPAVFPPEPLKKWVGYWKSEASRHWPKPAESPLWQRDYWDTQLRRGENYAAKWDYVRENPVRAGLVPRAEDWPFQGEENVLTWLG